MPSLISGRVWVWFVGGGTAVFLILVMAALAILLVPTPTSCPQPCSIPPPSSPPLPPPKQYTSSAYGYSLEYYFDAPKVADSKTVRWTLDGGWSYGFTAEPAQGRSPQQLVESIQRTRFADAAFLFQIPGAGLGYNPGYGAVYDLNVTEATGQPVRARLLVMVSVKKGLAVEMDALGPYDPKSYHPNPAATALAKEVSPVVNSVLFPGDPPL